jgi:hypothetical protein
MRLDVAESAPTGMTKDCTRPVPATAAAALGERASIQSQHVQARDHRNVIAQRSSARRPSGQ